MNCPENQLHFFFFKNPGGGGVEILGGPKIKSGKCHELPRKSIKLFFFLKPGGVGWKF